MKKRGCEHDTRKLCETCRILRNNEASKRYKEKNKEKVLARARVRQREYRAEDPERHRKQVKASRQRHLQKAKARDRSYHERTRERQLIRLRLHYANNKQRHADLGRVWRSANRQNESLRSRVRQGILNAHRCPELLLLQHGVCAICGASEAGGRGEWHSDHDHETGLLRGMLCHYCNIGLGDFRDSVQLLLAAARYLKKPPAGLLP